MVRYMSTQYPNKNSGIQRKGKKRDRNEKKGDDPKSEDKDNNTIDTEGAHVGDATTPKDSAFSSGEATQQMIYTLQEILYIFLNVLYTHCTCTILTPHIHHTSTVQALYKHHTVQCT